MDNSIFLSLREIQLLELEILKKVVSSLEKYNLRYVLCGGTLLGAIRHNGFIPWDDDIDILVPRDDYDRLIEIYKKDGINGFGVELRLPGDENYPLPFIKAVNSEYVVVEDVRDDNFKGYLWIDIFPLDHFPDDEKQHKKYINRNRMLRDVLSSNTISHSYLKNKGYYKKPRLIMKLIGSKFLYFLYGGYRKISSRMDNEARKMDMLYKKSIHVGDGVFPGGMKDYFIWEYTFPAIMHKFEDSVFCIPNNYDSYLTIFYGDYMKLPPIEKRSGHYIQVLRIHDYDTYYKRI